MSDSGNVVADGPPSSSPNGAHRSSNSNIPSNWAQKWTPEEDERLLAAIREYGDKNWKKVAEAVGTRDQVKCIQRWEKGLKPGIVKGRWREEEDRLLVLLVSQGHKNWGQVAANMPGRTSKQCRERWNNYLNPTLVHSPFTSEEDATILKLQSELGNKWAEIARALSGRTENAVKVRFHALIRQQQHSSTSYQASNADSSSSSLSSSSSSHSDPAAKRQRRETEDSTGLQIPMASESPVSSPLARSSIINSDDANEAFTDQHQSNENSATGSVES